MCKYCNEPYENMSISAGYIKIRKSKYSPSGYSLYADTSSREYGEADCPVWSCPMCGRDLTGQENKVEMKPVIHAHAIIDWLGNCKCSNCGTIDLNHTEPYRQHCGATLDEQEEREE